MSFFLLLRIKDILKNNQKVDGSYCFPRCGRKFYGSQWLPSTYTHYSKYLLLCSTEEQLIKVYNNLKVSKRWHNFHFAWTILLCCAIELIFKSWDLIYKNVQVYKNGLCLGKVLSAASGSKQADALLLVAESVGMRLSLSNSRRSPFSSKGFEHWQVPFFIC